jgi:hypothetical protein
MRQLSTALLAIPLLLLSPESSPAESYLQLISTRYPQGAELPSNAARPAPSCDFVSPEKLPAGAKVLSAAKAGNGRAFVMTDRGAFTSTDGGYEPLQVGPERPEPGQPEVRPYIRAVSFVGDPEGHVWMATDRGVYITDGDQWWQRLDHRDGLPVEAMTCLHLAPNGDVWGGTAQGAWRLRDGQFRYFWGKRWLPGNRVQAIWSDASGNAWIDTDQGAACIEEKPATLAEKAAHFDRIVQERHNRRGLICEIGFPEPGNPSKNPTFHVSDNDGLWTALYVAAMSLRYGATKDPEAREHARGSMKALLDLERLSGIPGFPARTLVTDEELRGGIKGVNLDAKVNAPGEDAKVWFRSKAVPGLWCKGDTSSDELDAQYFAWLLYYDLVADEAEKKEVAEVVRRVTDHIIGNGLTLVGHTGNKTRWGIWSPELINHHPFYCDLRPLNSLEILASLKVTEHMTGDPKYAEIADDLIEKHHYLLNSLMMRRGTTGQWPDINHSDDELLYLAYYPLLVLEKDPARRRILVQSIARTWEDSSSEQTIRQERSPFYNFAYGATTGRRCDPGAAAETLQDWPWELFDWRVQNSHRDDVVVKNAPGIHRHTEQLDRVLPASERSQGRWNSSPWLPDEGGEGRNEHDGVAWALGYWMGVYHGYLDAKE